MNGTVEPGLRRRGRRWVIVAAVLVLVAAGVAVAVGGGFDGGGGGGGPSGNGSATSLATVTRRSLSETTQFNGTLGYAGAFTVLGQAHGTVTRLPEPGRVVRNGQVLYRVDGAPVVLLYGPTPAYRALAEADANGADVAQLNHDLVALGYLSAADVDSAWDVFNWATQGRRGAAAAAPRGGADRGAGPRGCGVPAGRSARDDAAGDPRSTRGRGRAPGDLDGADGERRPRP